MTTQKLNIILILLKNKYMKVLFSICFFIIFHNAYSQTCNLKISIPNINKVKGEILIGVFNNKKAFPKPDKEFKTFFFKIKNRLGSYIIKGLPEDEYAIAIYHDENSDKKCNQNFIGIPQEGYGFSKNIIPFLSAPSFEDCKILLNKDKSIVIKLNY